MTDYRAIDADALSEELSAIADLLDSVDLPDDTEEQLDEHASNINGLIHSFNQPIQIRDRADSYELVVQTE